MANCTWPAAVVAALPDSPLHIGDRIVAVNGFALATGSPALVPQAEPARWSWQVGETVVYRLLRDDETRQVPVTLRPGWGSRRSWGLGWPAPELAGQFLARQSITRRPWPPRP